MIAETLRECEVYAPEALLRETMKQLMLRSELAKEREDLVSFSRLDQIDEAEALAEQQANFMFSTGRLILEARIARLSQEIATKVRENWLACDDAIARVNNDAEVIRTTLMQSHKESLRDAMLLGLKDHKFVVNHDVQGIETLVQQWSM